MSRTFRRGDVVAHVEEPLCRGRFVRISRVVGEAIVDFGLDGGIASIPLAQIKHAPVTVVGPLPTPLPTTCPSCGAPLTIDAEAVRYTPRAGWPARRQTVRVAACSGCEFIQEC